MSGLFWLTVVIIAIFLAGAGCFVAIQRVMQKKLPQYPQMQNTLETKEPEDFVDR